MEVLWICWLGIDPVHKWSFRHCALLKIGFVPENGNSSTFKFLDPSLVICGCYLIPAFVDGCMDHLLQSGPLVARLPGEIDNWASFYMNM